MCVGGGGGGDGLPLCSLQNMGEGHIPALQRVSSVVWVEVGEVWMPALRPSSRERSSASSSSSIGQVIAIRLPPVVIPGK